MSNLPTLRDKIHNSSLIQSPWSHLVIDNFLPQALYDELVDVVATTHTGEYAGLEHQIIINTKDSTEHTDFWQHWYRVFEDSSMTQCLADKFDLDKQFNTIRCDIHKCEPGFVLGPHNDNKGVFAIVSLQIYLAQDNDCAEDGVVLYNNDENKRIEYIPNRAWLFSASDDTVHAVPQCTRTRHSVLMKYICVGKQ